MQEQAFCAMGCTMHAIIDADSAQARAELAAVPGWFQDWERQLSRFDQQSELSRFNQAYDDTIAVSRPFMEVLQAALWAAQASGGLVTPTLHDQLVAAGYDRSFELIEREAACAQRAVGAGHIAADTYGSWRAIKFDPRARTVSRPAGIRLDFGGIAKGWAADRAARQLGRAAPALMDAGGDIALSGPRADGSPWAIAIEHPFEPGAEAGLLMLKRGGVATSGRGYRRWQHGDTWRHHILDARTGEPADTDVVNATVVAPSAVEAEVGAKVALILGSEEGIEWLEARPTMAGLLALADGTILISSRMHALLWQG